MEVITSSKFREKQKDIFEKIDRGIEIIITRGANSYRLLPLEDDTLMTKEELDNKIKLSLEQFKRGETVTVTSKLRDELFGDL